MSSLRLLFFDRTEQHLCNNVPLSAGSTDPKEQARSGLEAGASRGFKPPLPFCPNLMGLFSLLPLIFIVKVATSSKGTGRKKGEREDGTQREKGRGNPEGLPLILVTPLGRLHCLDKNKDTTYTLN